MPHFCFHFTAGDAALVGRMRRGQEAMPAVFAGQQSAENGVILAHQSPRTSPRSKWLDTIKL